MHFLPIFFGTTLFMLLPQLATFYWTSRLNISQRTEIQLVCSAASVSVAVGTLLDAFNFLSTGHSFALFIPFLLVMLYLQTGPLRLIRLKDDLPLSVYDKLQHLSTTTTAVFTICTLGVLFEEFYSLSASFTL